MTQSLGQRAVSGGFFTAGAQGAKFMLNLASAALLARLLSPKDFGLVGMVLAVTGLLGLFKDAGLSTATVQHEKITEQQVSNLFWINTGLGGFVCILSLALAPMVARFYRDLRVVGIMSWLSLAFLLTGATVQHQALLARQMRFRAIALIEVASMLLSAAVGCFLALLRLGYWALVGMQLCMAAASLALTWLASGWRPALPRSGSGVRPLLSFGAHLTASGLVGRVAANCDSVLIGRLFGSDQLGLYSRAGALVARPLDQLLAPVSAVVMPVLSRLQGDPQRYRSTFIRAYDTLALVCLPFAALCLGLAEPLVLIILGPKWKAAAPLFAGFSLVAVFLPLSVGASWLFMSQGRGRDLLHTYMLGGAVTLGSYGIGLLWGPVGVVLAFSASGFLIRLPVLYHIAGRQGPVRAAELWTSFLTHLPCWAAVYAAVTAARTMVSGAEPAVQVLVCVPFGLAAGGAVAVILARPRRTMMYGWSAVRNALLPGAPAGLVSIQNGLKRPRIALFGVFGIQNLGNECTLQAMLYNLRRRLPDAELYGICYEPGDTLCRHALPAVPIGRKRLSGPAARQTARPAGAARKLLRRLFRTLPAELLDWRRAVSVLMGTDLVAMTGTGMITDYHTSCFGYPYDILKWTAAAKLAGSRVAFVALGVGPIHEPLSRSFIRIALSLADYRSFRDEVSRARLRKLGLNTSSDPVVPDLAFSLPRSLLPKRRRHSYRGTVVGLGVMKHWDPHICAEADRETAYQTYVNKMCDFAGWLLDHGYCLRIVQGDLKHDPAVKRDLLAELERRGLCCEKAAIADEEPASVEDLLAQIAQTDVVISPRFHNLVLGLMLNKPAIAISYDSKTDALLEGIGLGEFRQPIDNLNVEVLIEQFRDLEARRMHLKPSLEAEIEKYRADLDKQYEILSGNFPMVHAPR